MYSLTGRTEPSALALRGGAAFAAIALRSGGLIAGEPAAKSRPALLRRPVRSAQRVRTCQ